MLGNALRMTGSALLATYRRGFLAFALAPLAIALIVVPEFVQHIAEIQNGMFDSRAGAASFANSALRWNFGYLKLTGLALAFLATARFWWCRDHGGRWWRLQEMAWPRLLGGLALFLLISGSTYPLRGHVPQPWLQGADLFLSIATLPLMFFILAGLFGDSRFTLASLCRRSWPYAILLLILFAAAFAPPQLLHSLLHKLALGQSRMLIWALMILDSLVVGLLASLVGAALYTAYAAMANHLADRSDQLRATLPAR